MSDKIHLAFIIIMVVLISIALGIMGLFLTVAYFHKPIEKCSTPNGISLLLPIYQYHKNLQSTVNIK